MFTARLRKGSGGEAVPAGAFIPAEDEAVAPRMNLAPLVLLVLLLLVLVLVLVVSLVIVLVLLSIWLLVR